MKRKSVARVGLLAVAMAVFGVLVLVAMAALSGGSAGGTLATGRSIMAYSDSLRVDSELRGDTATIRTDGKTIVIRPTEISIDGRPVATIDSSVSDVQVDVRDGVIKLIADGKTVGITAR